MLNNIYDVISKKSLAFLHRQTFGVEVQRVIPLSLNFSYKPSKQNVYPCDDPHPTLSFDLSL